MSRFPLRPVSVGQQYIDAKEPVNWAKAFLVHGSLELEIGCGAGGFAIDYCDRFKDVRYVAFEWRKKFAREVAHRAEKRGVANLHVVEGDAKREVPRMYAPQSIDVIHLQFPDPWWKRAHFKRAILVLDFTKILVSLLKPGGRFDFRTDVPDRAVAGLAILEAAGLQNPLGPGVFHPYDADEVPSTRERRYLATGQPVFRARLVKRMP
jgi:tRNA (guanine-N7-)-methyltransferase